jgi:hypothetical protein
VPDSEDKKCLQEIEGSRDDRNCYEYFQNAIFVVIGGILRKTFDSISIKRSTKFIPIDKFVCLSSNRTKFFTADPVNEMIEIVINLSLNLIQGVTFLQKSLNRYCPIYFIYFSINITIN